MHRGVLLLVLAGVCHLVHGGDLEDSAEQQFLEVLESLGRVKRGDGPSYRPRPTMRPFYVAGRLGRSVDSEEEPQVLESLGRVKRGDGPPYRPRPTMRPFYVASRLGRSVDAQEQQALESLDRVKRARGPPTRPRPTTPKPARGRKGRSIIGGETPEE